MLCSVFFPLQGQQWQECPASRREKSQLFECLGWQMVATVCVATSTGLHLISMFLRQAVSAHQQASLHERANVSSDVSIFFHFFDQDSHLRFWVNSKESWTRPFWRTCDPTRTTFQSQYWPLISPVKKVSISNLILLSYFWLKRCIFIKDPERNINILK